MPQAHATFVIDARLRSVAARQLGLITVDDAAQVGVDKQALARRRNAGALHAVFRHVMRLDAFPISVQQRALAAALAVPGTAVAGPSAACILGFPLPDRRGSTADEVLVSDANRACLVPGLTVIRSGVRPPTVAWMTTRVTTPAATVLLLPRFVDAATVERCLDHSLAHRLTSVASMRALIERMPSRAVHGRALLLDLLADRSNGMGHRSGKEHNVGRWLTRARLKGWTRNLQVAVRSSCDVEIEVDFGWPSVRVALEVSPFFTHGSRAKQERDAERRRFLVAAGWRVVEAVDSDLRDEAAFAAVAMTLRRLGAA